MNSHEFIVKSITSELERLGFAYDICKKSADEALQYYLSNSHFKKGAIADTLSFAKRRAKKLKECK